MQHIDYVHTSCIVTLRHIIMASFPCNLELFSQQLQQVIIDSISNVVYLKLLAIFVVLKE